jgi:hypothetical protein
MWPDIERKAAATFAAAEHAIAAAAREAAEQEPEWDGE